MTVYHSFPHWRGSTVAMHSGRLREFTDVHGCLQRVPRGVVFKKELVIVTCVC